MTYETDPGRLDFAFARDSAALAGAVVLVAMRLINRVKSVVLASKRNNRCTSSLENRL